MSHRLTTSAKGLLVRTGKYELDTLPHPMTPVRIRFGSSPRTDRTPDATAAPASTVVFVNSRRFRELRDVFIGMSGSILVGATTLAMVQSDYKTGHVGR